MSSACGWRGSISPSQNDADGVLASESYNTDRFLPGWLRAGLTATANAWYAIVGVLAVVSLWWWLRRRDLGGWLLFLSALGVGVLPIVVFFGDPRFHVPIDPLIAILAAGLLSGWLRRTAADSASATSSAEPAGDASQPRLPAPAGG